MSTSVLLVLLLSCFLSATLSAPPVTNRTITLILNDCCGPIKSYFLRTLTLPDPSLNLSLSLNLTTADRESTVVYTQQWNDPADDNIDGLTADPTAANPSFLTAHRDYTFVQYVQSPLNATSAVTPTSPHPTPAPHLSNMMPYPQADVHGVGLHYVELHYLFYLDLTQSYYAIAYIDVEGPSRTDFDFMVFTSPEQYSGGVTAARPTYADTRQVPADSYPGLLGSRAAINQEQALVFVNVVFWQASEPDYQSGWLWTFDVRKNAVVSEVSYPLNMTGEYDLKTELVWSSVRQTLYGATFPETDSGTGLQLDTIDPVDGTVVRLATYDNVIMDDYDSCQSLDDQTGEWWFASNNPYTVPSYGLVWQLYSVNVVTGVLGPSHTLNTPYSLLGFSFIPPPSIVATTAALTTEPAQVDERQTAAQRQRAKRLQSKKQRSRKVSVPAVVQQ